MKVTCRLLLSSQPITIEDVTNTYQKGDLFCILSLVDGVKKVRKIPIQHIFDIVEDY